MLSVQFVIFKLQKQSDEKKLRSEAFGKDDGLVEMQKIKVSNAKSNLPMSSRQ